MNKQKVSKIIMFVILGLLIITISHISGENKKLKGKVDSVKHRITLSQIQWDLVQLEGAIAYQIETQWRQPAHVREKVGDVLQDITVIMDVTQSIGVLSDQEKSDLTSFYNRLKQYPNDNSVEPVTELSQSEIEKFNQLRIALREVEWGIGFSNSGHWDSFVEKLTKLLPLI